MIQNQSQYLCANIISFVKQSSTTNVWTAKRKKIKTKPYETFYACSGDGQYLGKLREKMGCDRKTFVWLHMGGCTSPCIVLYKGMLQASSPKVRWRDLVGGEAKIKELFSSLSLCLVSALVLDPLSLLPHHAVKCTWPAEPGSLIPVSHRRTRLSHKQHSHFKCICLS